MSDRNRALVTLVQALSVLIIIATVAVIAVPKAGDLQRRGTATKVLADVEAMREAVYAFYSDSAYFPAESPGEAVPAGLVPYLPRTFSFTRMYGTIAYKNWPNTVTVSPSDSAATHMVGAIVTTHDPRIAATAGALSRGTGYFTIGNKSTFLFFGG